jgi:myosin heavy subunit
MTDHDSLWLQKSINLSDPLDVSMESNRSSNKGGMNPSELDAIALRPAARLSDGLRQGRAGSSARLSSIANAMGGFNPFEVDELKGKLAQLNREKLRWEDSARDLERSKTELQQARDDYKALEEYTHTIKVSADEAGLRAERDAKLRQEAESKLLEAMRGASKEQLALKSQIDEVKKVHSHKLFELKETLEQEKDAERTRAEQERDEIVREYETKVSLLERRIEELTAKVAASEIVVANAKDAFQVREKELHQQLSQAQMELSASRTAASNNIKQMQDRMDTMARAHNESIESVKATSAEQLFLAREESKNIQDNLQQRLAAIEEKHDALKDDMFRAKSDLQASQSAMKQLRTSHEAATLHAAELHAKELDHARSDLSALEANINSVQKSLSDSQNEQRATYARLLAEQSTARDLAEKLASQNAETTAVEEKLRAAIADIEARDVELDEIAEVMQRMNNERDTTVKGYSEDLVEARARCDKLEGDLSSARLNLSNERKAHLATDGTYRRTIAELREQLTNASSTNVSAHTEDLEAQQHLRVLCEELAQRVRSLESDNESLRDELSRTQAKRPRTGLVEVTPNVVLREPSMKKHRPEPVERVFAVSGFEGPELKALKQAIEDLPCASLVECRSNAPLPASVTHLVASGQLTVKLLSAAVKGCWVVPKSYVESSATVGDWNDEATCGFRHASLPLSGKSIYFTPAFKSSKHFSTAKLLVDQGGAIPSSSEHGVDFVLSVASEAPKFASARSWETFVNEIYPVQA